MIEATTEIKKGLKAKNEIIGTERVIKNLKMGKVKKAFISSNCSKSIKDSINRYAKIADVEVIQLTQNNSELGILCKKPFSISVLALKA